MMKKDHNRLFMYLLGGIRYARYAHDFANYSHQHSPPLFDSVHGYGVLFPT